MVHDRCNCYFSLWVIFCPFTPVTAQKMKISKKQKKDSRYHHFTQVYQNDDHMLYCSWDMACDWCNYYFFYFGLFFALLSHNSPKTKKFKKCKKLLEISFYTSVPKIMIICYTIPEIWHMTDVIVTFHFGLFFAPFTPITAQKMKIKKKTKKRLKISSFYISVSKWWSYAILFLRYGIWLM